MADQDKDKADSNKLAVPKGGNGGGGGGDNSDGNGDGGDEGLEPNMEDLFKMVSDVIDGGW
ncbi:hypothetical protein QC762_0059370 [Podospora pseudocomata]|uniref:Uncharacterized protein n=1 Tax=Podospora pseudocomata TaxID=2093779 RepID=A0ABR0GKS1_9PEZI|nr:hypothetical protein QC762_0059370 [Podospora pseudocomata]